MVSETRQRETWLLSVGTGMPSSTQTVVPPVGLARAVTWQWYTLAVYVAAAALVGALVYVQMNWRGLGSVTWSGAIATALFAAVGVFAERLRIHVGERSEVSAGFLADFLAAALLGPLAGAVVAACGAAASWERGQLVRTAFYSSAFSMAGGACGVVFYVVTTRWPGSSGTAVAVGGVAAGMTYQVLNYLLFVPIAWLRRGVGPIVWFDETFRPYLPFHVFFLLLSLGLVYSFENQGRGVFVLLFLPVLGLIYAFRSFGRQKELTQSLERFSLQMAASMITALDLKDNYTAQHSAAVAQYSFDLARRLGLSPRQRGLAHLAGLLHDLGKISVPDRVLNSLERLADDEWDIVRGHSLAGQKVLSNMHEFEELGLIVLHHHERFDGTGYPYGLCGEEIPILSRIVAVADSYSAMVSDRPYRGRRSPEDASAELEKQSGGQYDPRVVAAFIEVLEDESEEYRRSEHIDFHLQFQKVRFLGDFA
jgi:putative nucleotidyltransferase with HDIG domain